MRKGKIGVFDSGYGGLTILEELVKTLPNYSYVYLGDNARAPYGTKSYDVVYQYTLEAVEFLFHKDCELVVLACNTASAKALRSIQQNILPEKYPEKKVLGVIRPSTELVGSLSQTNKIGVLATQGTVNSRSYIDELKGYYKGIQVFQQACPLWVPLIENDKWQTIQGKELIKEDVKQLLNQASGIDTIILACTHFPLIYDFLREIIPPEIKILGQGNIVAESLMKYLENHNEVDSKLCTHNNLTFYTSENTKEFDLFIKSNFKNKFKYKNVNKF